MTVERKHLDFKTEIKALSNMQFEAYAATFGNKDHHDDVIEKGAFLDTLTKRMPKLLYQHNTSQIVGVIKSAVEDSNGLLISGMFIDTPLGNQVYQEVKAGAIDQMSIGFSPIDVEYDGDVRKIKKIALYEASFVTFPANEMARVVSVKADDIATIRDFEKALRELGFSKEKAVAIASNGFKSKDTERDVEVNSNDTGREAEANELKSLIISLTKQIKGDKDD